MSRQGDQEHRDMSDGAVVLGRLKATDCRRLHGDCQEPGKDSFGRCSLIVYSFKPLAVVIDMPSDRWTKPQEIITSFLLEVLGMKSRAHQEAALKAFAIVERAAVLEIGSASCGHFTSSVHFQMAGADNGVLFHLEFVFLMSSWVFGDYRHRLHFIEDVGEDLFAIIVGISRHRLDSQLKQRSQFPKQWQGLFFSS